MKTRQIMNLSEYSSEVVGFDSTWDRDKQVLVKDASTDVIETGTEISDKFTSTNETNEIGVNIFNELSLVSLSKKLLS